MDEFPDSCPPTVPADSILVKNDDGDSALEWVVSSILDHQSSADQGLLLKSHWLGYPPSESTWEPLTLFIRPFTQALLVYFSKLSDSAKEGVRAHWPSKIKKPSSLKSALAL